MFHMISMNEVDRDSQRFLWRESDDQKVKIYRMNRVVFGLKCSPYTCIKTILEHVKSNKDDYPAACQQLEENLFVDDVLSGETNSNGVSRLANDMKFVLEKGGFPLRKFLSSHPESLSGLDCEDLAEYHMDLSDGEVVTKTLGIMYIPKEDVFRFKYHPRETEVITRRIVLSELQRLFDPMGLLSPLILKAKLVFQRAWSEVDSWDDELSEELVAEWEKWKNGVSAIDQLNIPRCYLTDEIQDPKYGLRGFGDASEAAYGAVVYLRIEDGTGVRCVLLASKTRVAPLKHRGTLAELELMASLLVARLIRYAEKGHLPGKLNPADLCSRGCHGDQLVESNLWWQGPEFLRSDESQWPVKGGDKTVEAKKYLKKKFQVEVNLFQGEEDTTSSFHLNLLSRYSSWGKLIAVSTLLRKCFKGVSRNEGSMHPLVLVEQREEELYWVQWAQYQSYRTEINCLKAGRPLPKDSKLKQLDPIWDAKSMVLRVGGRLYHAKVSRFKKNPMILPPKCLVSDLLVKYYHRINGHPGNEQTLASLRDKYWLVHGRNEVKRIQFHCKCKEPKQLTQKMGELPPERVVMAPAFSSVGVDFAGPLLIKENGSEIKSYIALFTCMITRGIHLELTYSMNAEDFLMSFRRMMNRRGKPAIMYSDNAKTFKKSAKVMIRLYDQKKWRDTVVNKVKADGIEWKFITERGPWKGGFYERLVRSVKTALKVVLGKAKLTFTELSTILTDVESQINSRPLTVVSNDKNDPEPLSPGDCMIGRKPQFLPDVDSDTSKANFGKRWCYQQRLAKQYWKRWTREYLVELLPLKKWFEKKENVRIGDVVLVSEDGVKRPNWQMGRIHETHMGRDGLVRSVTLKTARGFIRRPLQRLYLLEASEAA
ncbi:uncharacterized protein LOC141902115 [Tubulanus polymorphus]|uniref:uncharacterized protein LOC141902115 n=1 Tax=Tubulanus polymorphus TaxID=672921 RepID=UPI003DA42CAD